MYETLPYIFIILTSIIIVLYTYIRIKYGFWFLQPVFHVYDFWYMFAPPGIINHELPKENRYTNFKNIETIVYKEISHIKLQKFVNFININYLQNKDNVFSPTIKNVAPYFTGHNDISFVSFYTEKELVTDLKKGTIVEDARVVGAMTSRPIHVFINKGDKESYFDAYYVDYLCVDKNYRKKGIAPQIIQTHHYNQSHINKKISVSLFKREDELTGIVPLCVYSTYGFSMEKWHKPLELHAMYKLLEINEQNYHFLVDFMKATSRQFEIIINTEHSNIIELIKTKNIFVYVLMEHDSNSIKCAYFYRKSCVFYEKGLEILSCFASINGFEDSYAKDNDNHIFIQGFKISFWKTAEKNYFGFAVIENISHNNLIIENICMKTAPVVVSPTAYFFYNFAYHSFKHNKVLVIN
uniref:Glycylpeptide N-tetradecanoyltransferase n=1 Tax=viral metagenome TaxID=1070528 RepID=A0A6C0JIQ9_9ZZZZ